MQYVRSKLKSYYQLSTGHQLTMKILIADRIAEEGIAWLREHGEFTVTEAYGAGLEVLLEAVREVEAIIVRSETQITVEVIEAARHLKVIGRAGVGIDNIDVQAATERGVIVMNAPGGNTIATAELAFTHLLCAARPIVPAAAAMRAGEWERKRFIGRELYQKKLGILGMGRIGAEISKRAQAFGMTVLAYDPYLTEERARTLHVKKSALAPLLQQVDYITIHVPKTEATTGLINAEAFSQMTDGVCLITCARGGIIDEGALLQALKDGKVQAVGLDVYESEPLATDHPLRAMEQTVLTPHLGASTQEAQIGVGIEIAQSVAETLSGKSPRNAVNMPAVDERSLGLLQPYLKLGTSLGSLLQQMAPQQVEKIKITYFGAITELDLVPLTRRIQRGYLSKISGEAANDINAPYLLKNLGVQTEVSQSEEKIDYHDLIRLEVYSLEGATCSVAATLFGKTQEPRVVHINDRDIEVALQGHWIILGNQDRPGTVGKVGMILGQDRINIANMVLSRNAVGGPVLSVFQLDSEPSQAALEAIGKLEEVESVHTIAL